MDREINLIGYLPEVLSEIDEIKEIMNAENPEFELVSANMSVAVDNCFIATMNENSCLRWENMLGIKAKATDTLENRRFAIQLALNGDRPYTMITLENKLKTMCGEDNYTLEYANDIYTLNVTVSLTVKAQYEAVVKFLYEIVPANIVINCSLAYNKYSTLSGYTHGELAAYTHQQLREEVLQ